MKRLFAVLLILCLLLGISGCRTETDIRGTQSVQTAPDHQPSSPGEDATSPSAEATAPSQQPTEPAAQDTTPTAGTLAPTVPEETTGSTVKPGAVQGVTYESDFIGIGCKLSGDWSFYSDQQIRQLNQIAEELAGDAYQQALANASVVYDMFAIHNSGANNVSVVLEKIDPVQLVLMDIPSSYEASIPLLKQSLSNMGYTGVQCSVDTVWMGENEVDCIRTQAYGMGTTLYQCSISIKCKGYLATVTITTTGQDMIEQILGCFYEV